MKTALYLMLFYLIFSCGTKNNSNKPEGGPVDIFIDTSEESIAFAAKNIQNILHVKGYNVKIKQITSFIELKKKAGIVITKDNAKMRNSLYAVGGDSIPQLHEQEFAMRVTGNDIEKCYWVFGGDRIGAMYGGIHLGEIIQAFGLTAVKNEEQSPYIKKRGIKFNIPLDDRQQSHDDRGTAAQSNIPNMWDFEFWKEYLDALAIQRYNVLSLWNKHPFPSLVKLEEYPKVALDDVYDAQGKVLDITIDEKIKLWQNITEYAYQRGIDIYIITWNIHLEGARAKHNIWHKKKSETTKDYLRKSVKQLFLTYPRLAGIGVTAGENMDDMNADEKEQWLWETYGKGVQDVNNIQPNRHIKFIHRFWWTSFNQINSRFGSLKDGFDMSFKYSGARIYSDPAPGFAAQKLFPYLPDTVSTWWNIRNDDIYNLRWGDPDYVKQFILNFPKGSKTAGYYMGSDRYVWGRESISKNPTSPRMLENKKHWYSFLLWGRLGYNPYTSNDLLKGLIHYKFPNVNEQKLFDAWQVSSKIIPLVNKFHWFKWDYLWWVEAGVGSGSGSAICGYHNINDFINTPVMKTDEMMSINEYVKFFNQKDSLIKLTPFEVADSLQTMADKTFIYLKDLKPKGDIELKETLGDIKAMAYLGLYYSNKIRGATYLGIYNSTKEEKYKHLSVKNLEKALLNWQNYSDILDEQYNKMNISSHRVFDWDKLELEVKKDIEIAKSAQ